MAGLHRATGGGIDGRHALFVREDPPRQRRDRGAGTRALTATRELLRAVPLAP
jgi:hypothetical protein